MELLGKIPSVGDTFDFKGWHITVTKATSHHATQLTMVSPEEGARDE